MTPTPSPEVQPLPHTHRRIVFIVSLLVFVMAVPTFVFYAVGYRFDFSGEVRSIKSVGGMYISADAQETDIFIDDEPVEDMRIFQRAAYIQNLAAGVHRVHVQGEGVHTWVKELPVFAHFVTEASSFNMPVVPQVRLLTEYQNTDGRAVLTAPTSTSPLVFASSSQEFFVATSTATSTLYDVNPEYTYIANRFASSTEEKLLMEAQEVAQRKTFQFSDEAVATTSATTTKTYRDTILYELEGEVYIDWVGQFDAVPYYYCVRFGTASTTETFYGEHVVENVVAQVQAAFTNEELMTESEMEGERWCRTTIKIDNLRKEVEWFDYYPNSIDLVLMQLSDGLYVVEVDDRSWQNTQLLYPGEDIKVIKDGDSIFVQDGTYFLEVFTELLEQ